jgi:hypothetical protein
VHWQPADDCGANFTDLFEEPESEFFTLLSPRLAQLPRSSSEGLIRDIVARQHRDKNVAAGGRDQQNVDVFPDYVFFQSVDRFANPNKKPNVLLAYYNGLVTLEHTPCQYYLRQSSIFLNILKPVARIQQFIDSVMNSHFEVNDLFCPSSAGFISFGCVGYFFCRIR